MENAAKEPRKASNGVLSPQIEEEQKDWSTITTREKVRNSYLKMLRRMAPNRASRVMVPVRNEAQTVRPGSAITVVPDITDPAIEVLDQYSVVSDYAYVRITYNNNLSEYLYEVIEPTLNREEQELLDLLKDTLHRTLGYEWEKLTQLDKEEYLRESVDSFIRTRGIRVEQLAKKRIGYYIIRDFVGHGPIDVMMRDDMVEDISCDGYNVPIFIFHGKWESTRSNIIFTNEDELNSFVVTLAQRSGKQISVAAPILDGTTVEGHRVQATYSREVTTRGSTFTIRRFKNKPFTPTDLMRYKTVSPEMMAYLWIGVENGESMILVGGTASGKTSALNSLAIFIPPGAKIVTIEDTREINLPHENWIPGATRTGVGERDKDGRAAGEIDMYDLVRAALRQRPNYIIVGEVRGKETYIMFQAMATGHSTYSTMHADSVKSMVNRLENPPINCPRILLTALRNVLIQSQVKVGNDFVRRMKQIVEIVGFEPETNELITNTVYEWDPATDRHIFKGHSFLFDKIMEMKSLTHDEMMAEFDRRVEVVSYLLKKDIRNHREIWNLVNSYYKDHDKTLDRIHKDLAAMEVN
ncbi:MAG: type II/IV secretion system ATPase subunit [Methanomassiliicoccales archaeon]